MFILFSKGIQEEEKERKEKEIQERKKIQKETFFKFLLLF